MRDCGRPPGQPRSRQLQVPDHREGNFRLRIAAGAAALFFCAGVAIASEPTLKRWTGAATPRLALPDASGQPFDLRDLRGQVVLVNFWATWCEPCRAEMASLERLQAGFADRPFKVLTVNYGESREKVAAFATSELLDLPMLLDRDTKVAGAWGVKGLPTSFLVDAGGRIRYWLFGERDWNDAEARRIVEQLLAEKPAPATR